MSNKLKVSVVMTVYNGERYLERAFAGVLDQRYDTYEVVIVDDGSTDRTPDLLEAGAQSDSRIRIFRPGRLGRAAALNFGIASSP